MAVARRGDPAGDVGREVRCGRLARDEAAVGLGHGRDPVDAEGAPVLALAVPGDEVPPPPGVDQAVRLDEAAAARAVVAAVAEAQALAVAARAGDRREDLALDGRAGDGEQDG